MRNTYPDVPPSEAADAASAADHARKRSARDAFGHEAHMMDPHRPLPLFRGYPIPGQPSVSPSSLTLNPGQPRNHPQAAVAHRSLPQPAYTQRDYAAFPQGSPYSSSMYAASFPPHPFYTPYRSGGGPSGETAAAAELEAATPSSSTFVNEMREVEVTRSVKGLRHFSRCVADKVQLKGTTTYNEVADELVEELTIQARDTNTKFDHKNIRRRVYDALNVLMAMEIIQKDRKEIRWTGLPSEGFSRKELEALQRRNAELRALNEAERRLVNERLRKQRLLKALLNHNAQQQNIDIVNCAGVPPQRERLNLPFLLLRSAKDSQVHVEMNVDKSQCVISFSKPFDLVEDMDVVAMFVGGMSRNFSTPYRQESTVVGQIPIPETSFQSPGPEEVLGDQHRG